MGTQRITVGRLKTILNPYGETTTLMYDNADRRIGLLLANGNVTSLSYDDANRLDAVESRKSTTALLGSYNYLLDPAGNRTTLTASGSDGFLWAYDKTNQLRNEQRTLSGQSYSHTFVYDTPGNRTRLEESSTDIISSIYDDANRLRTVEDVSGVTTYAYDENGNPLAIEEPSGDITTNTWNGEDRLVQVEHPDDTITTYAYNADGLRVSEDHDGTVNLFVYDGNNRLQETDDVGLVEAEFTYIPLPYAEVLSQRRDTESSFYLSDGIRNVRQLTDDAEVVTDEYVFDAFGNLRSASGSTANSQLYKGQLLSYRDDPHAGPETETSLHHRNLSSKTGRLTSEDPAADDLNLYRYVGNNPVNGEDPSGLQEDDNIQGVMWMWKQKVHEVATAAKNQIHDFRKHTLPTVLPGQRIKINAISSLSNAVVGGMAHVSSPQSKNSDMAFKGGTLANSVLMVPVDFINQPKETAKRQLVGFFSMSMTVEEQERAAAWFASDTKLISDKLRSLADASDPIHSEYGQDFAPIHDAVVVSAL